MSDVYADVGRSAATIALRLGRFAEGKRLEKDRLALRAVRDRLRHMSEGTVVTDADENDPIFTTIEGQVVVIYAIREKLGNSDAGALKGCLAAFAEKMAILVSEGSRDDVAEELDAFFCQVHELADEISVVGLKANPVFEVFGALVE